MQSRVIEMWWVTVTGVTGAVISVGDAVVAANAVVALTQTTRAAAALFMAVVVVSAYLPASLRAVPLYIRLNT